MWIAESPALVGDAKLGETERERFLPTEYDAKGFAIDARGVECRDLACPHCHLRIPSEALERSTVYMSIVGAPACGKSYYLAASTWSLRKLFPRRFRIDFLDADPEMNRKIQEYETRAFLGPQDEPVELDKTEVQGELYDAVRFEDGIVSYPKPFVFSLSPSRDHPNIDKVAKLSKLLCLYDNAGESFLPARGADSATSPTTRHLGRSDCVFFLFDPTQDARFRADFREYSSDPQLDETNDAFRRSPARQDAVFEETIRRIRASKKMYANDRFEGLLVVVVSKLDVWKSELPADDIRKDPISVASYQGTDYCFLRGDKINRVSRALRTMLARRAPEFVAAAEGFANEVVYIPVSATGCSPTIDEETKRRGFRPKDLNPIWIGVPLLYALARFTKGLVPIRDAEPEVGEKFGG